MRYCFVQDDDSHWYMIAPDQRESFDNWVQLTESGESCDVDFTDCRLNGGISWYTFTDPQEEQ